MLKKIQESGWKSVFYLSGLVASGLCFYPASAGAVNFTFGAASSNFTLSSDLTPSDVNSLVQDFSVNLTSGSTVVALKGRVSAVKFNVPTGTGGAGRLPGVYLSLSNFEASYLSGPALSTPLTNLLTITHNFGDFNFTDFVDPDSGEPLYTSYVLNTYLTGDIQSANTSTPVSSSSKIAMDTYAQGTSVLLDPTETPLNPILTGLKSGPTNGSSFFQFATSSQTGSDMLPVDGLDKPTIGISLKNFLIASGETLSLKNTACTALGGFPNTDNNSTNPQEFSFTKDENGQVSGIKAGTEENLCHSADPERVPEPSALLGLLTMIGGIALFKRQSVKSIQIS